MTQTTAPPLVLFSGNYQHSAVFNSHFLQGDYDEHPLLTQAVKLSLPIDRTSLPHFPLTATGQSLERACRWYTPLQKSQQLGGLYYEILTEGEAAYYLLVYFPQSKSAPVDVRSPFTLLVLEVTADLPKPNQLWPMLVGQIQASSILIHQQ